MVYKNERVNYIIPLLILILTWPLLSGYFFIFARTWLWVLMGCLVIAFLCPSYYLQSKVIWMAVFFIVLLMNFFSGDKYYSSIQLICLEVGVMLFSSSIVYYLNVKNRNKEARLIAFEVLIIVSIISIMSYLLDLINPGIIRSSVSAMNRENETSLIYSYYRMGMSNYELPHALPVIIPPLVLGIKNRRLKLWSRILLVVVLVLTIVLTNLSGSATSVFLVFMMLFLSLFTRVGSVKNNLNSTIIILLLFLPLFFVDDLKVLLIDFFASLTPGEGTVYDRLMEIEESIIRDKAQGDLNGRLLLYSSSFNGFFESILVGTNSKVGGHSAFIDRLATLGLVGFLPYVVFIWKQVKQTVAFIPNNLTIFYIEGLLAGFIMLLSKNMSNWEMWLMVFVVLPLLTIILGKDNKESLFVQIHP